MNKKLSQLYRWTALAAVLLPAAAAGSEPAALPIRGESDWSPYVAGGLIGLLSMVTFYLSDKPIGVSTAYARIAGMLGKLFAPRHTESLPYFKETRPVVDWEVMFLAGILLGGLIAAWTGGQLADRWLPPLWEARFGEGSIVARLVSAFAGGALMAFGARLAGGCTSGHGISGTLQLSVGSWVSLLCFFLGGMAVAMPLFR